MQGSLNLRTNSFRCLNRLAPFSFVSALVLSFLMFNPLAITSNKASATTSAVESSITITSLANSATVNVRALTENGFFATSTAEQSASFALTTNNYTGYTLSIMSDDDDGNLSTAVEPGDTPKILNSISGITSAEDFSASTVTAAENYNSKWGIRPSKYVDATSNTTVDNTGDNPVYLPSPTTIPTLLDKTTSANATANTYTLALGVRANQDTESGVYTKVLGLAVIANPVSYIVEYDQNTNDVVTNMPATQANDSMTDISLALSDAIPLRDHYSFIGWCDVQPTTTNEVDSCAGTIYNPNGDGTNLTYSINQTIMNEATLYAMWKIDTFTCNRQYRLQNADGTWGEYQEDASETINYGGTCSYSKTVTDYKGSISVANDAAGFTSAPNITSDTTLDLDLYRNTYELTVSAGPNTVNPTGSGTYRWGEDVAVGVTKASDTTCTLYDTPTWAQSGDAGSLSSTSGTNTIFTMGKGDATVTATSAASSVAQAIALSRSGGASSINIDGTDYAEDNISLSCGTYDISGNYDSGYEFDSWSTSGSISVADTSANSTTMTVSGAGTLTLAGKQSCVATISGTMQNFSIGSTNYCESATGTLTDSRDGEVYNVAKLADGKIWLLDNLRLDLSVTRTLTTADTNITSDWTAPTNITPWPKSLGSNTYTSPRINTEYKDTIQSYGSGSGKIGVYYNYCAATAGTYCYYTDENGGNATSDICPKGWRMPTADDPSGEYLALYKAYSSNATDFKNALRTPLSGYINDGYLNNSQGSRGKFWSSTPLSNNASFRMYNLDITSSSVNPQDYGDRYYGYSVRCVLKGATNISQISTMQDFASNDAPAIKDSMIAGQQYALIDGRNGNKNYTVAKIDNRIWMTANLDLPGGTTLTPTDSNVVSDYTLPDSSITGFSGNDATVANVYNSGSTTCGDDSPCYSYYSYAAATAGTNPTNNVTYDICPKGWRLPRTSDYTSLTNTYTTGATLIASPFHGVYAGYYEGSFFRDGGGWGLYWTAIVNNSFTAYRLAFGSSGTSIYAITKGYGLPVRCIVNVR